MLSYFQCFLRSSPCSGRHLPAIAVKISAV